MALNLNASPYYDDFSDDKRFHKILFKPGVAVQARELTQLQAVLQDQFDIEETELKNFIVQFSTYISKRKIQSKNHTLRCNLFRRTLRLRPTTASFDPGEC